MKRKVLLFFFLLFLFYTRNQIIDMSVYQSDTKEIEVKGEVQKPGVYEVAYDATIEEVLQECGGTLEQADLSRINQTMRLPDQSVLVVPKVQEQQLISINQATKEELMTLSGVGESTAQRIIEYRQDHSFQTIEDIMNVKGIKEKLFEKIKDFICL